MSSLLLRFRSRFTPWLALLATLALLAGLTAPAQAAGGWTATGTLVHSHMWHAAALLADGRVLVAGGGESAAGWAGTEILDPATGTWAATGSMSVPRSLYTATLLTDGRVLVAGGIDNPVYTNVAYASAEIYNPATGTWAATGSMTIARSQHTATRLNDGRVLVVSGTTTEIYNPATGAWTATGNLGTSHGRHTATLLSNGRVLVAGGIGSGGAAIASAEIYNPSTGTWAATGSLGIARSGHTATALTDGRVLVAGGAINVAGVTTYFSSAELYDPATGTWTATGNLGTTRADHTATLLSDGRVLAVGGLTNGSLLASAELYDPATGAWAAASSMINARSRHTATGLNDGRVLVVGGGGDGSGICCAEIFSLSGTPTPTPVPASITVTAPNGGETWRIGASRSIQWSATGITGNVTIQISRDGGGTYTTIASNMPNSGAFQWTVTGPATTRALIRVSSVSQPAVQDTSNSTFTIRR
jgi:N-acetylneuraminic acid mutarotase